MKTWGKHNPGALPCAACGLPVDAPESADVAFCDQACRTVHARRATAHRRNPSGYPGSATPKGRKGEAATVEVRPVTSSGARPRVKVPASSAIATGLDAGNDARRAVARLAESKAAGPKKTAKKTAKKKTAPKVAAAATPKRGSPEQLRLINPGRPGVSAAERERIARLALQWSWGRYDTPKVVDVASEAWQPDSGFALGRLEAIEIGGVRLEPESAAWLVATREGRGDLFVVPPVALPAALDGRPVTRIEYVTQKGQDTAGVIYEHDLEPAYPIAQSRGGVLEIKRGRSAFLINPDRGLVELSER